MKAFIICLPQKENSLNHSRKTKDILTGYGYDAELFEGISGTVAVELAHKERRKAYPYGIKTTELEVDSIKKYIKDDLWEKFLDNFIITVQEKSRYVGNKIDKISSPGVKGCFYSHYRLWEKCTELDEPIMIFEDDVKIYRNVNFKEYYWQDILILAFGKTLYNGEPYKTYLENPKGPLQIVPWTNSSMPGTQAYAIKPNAARKLVKHYRPWFLPSDNAIHSSICKIEILTHVMGRELFGDEGNSSAVRTKGEPW